MKALTTVALANALAKQASPIKGNLTPGVHIVDEVITVRVTGKVTKGENIWYTPTAEIPILPVLAILIEKSGAVGMNLAGMIGDAMQEAILYGKDRETVDGEALPDLSSREAIEQRMKDLEATMEKVPKVTGDLPLKEKSGGTRCKVTVEEAKFVPAEAA
jgi:hypothetical protein